MLLKPISDIHIDVNNFNFEIDNLNNNTNKNTVLILAGDISNNMTLSLNTIKKYEDYFKHIIFVPGNHDFYNSIHHEVCDYLNELNDKMDNISILQENDVVIDDIQFVGTTLWANFNPLVSNLINDFKYIYKNETELINVDYILEYHHKAIDYLNSIKQSNYKKVVITHYCPSFNFLNKKYTNNLLTSGLASDLDNLILDINPIYWIHGHTHDNYIKDINNVKVVCNAYGNYFDNTEFKHDLVLEI